MEGTDHLLQRVSRSSFVCLFLLASQPAPQSGFHGPLHFHEIHLSGWRSVLVVSEGKCARLDNTEQVPLLQDFSGPLISDTLSENVMIIRPWHPSSRNNHQHLNECLPSEHCCLGKAIFLILLFSLKTLWKKK